MPDPQVPDAFEPQPAQPPADPQAQQDIAGRWRGFLSDPAARTALIQFGIGMMQPIQPGQTAIGQVGQSLGGAGEAVGRVAEQDLAQREQTSKENYRTQTGEAASVRAQAGIERATSANENSRLRMEMQQRFGAANLNIKNQLAYQRYKKAQTDAQLLDPKVGPPVDYETFLKDAKLQVQHGAVGAGDAEDASLPPASASPAESATVPSATGPDGTKIYFRNGKWGP